MFKKVLAVMLVLLLLVGFGAWGNVFAQVKFPDVPESYWAYKEINKLVELGILKGYPDGTFKPGNNVTRAEFATMVVLAKKLTLVSPARPSFKDVPTNHWAYKQVETAAKAGYLKGYPDGTFGPSRNITRQEIAAVLVNVLGLTPEASKITEPVCLANDENKIASWAIGAMTIAVRPKVQVLKWDKDRNIRPTVAGTRAECAFGVYQILYPPTTNTKKTMSIVNEEGPESFMQLTSDSAYTAMAVSFLHSGLIGAHPSGTMFPEMAVAVPSEANGLLKVDKANQTMEVTYKLRKGIKWWDGTEVTADDIMTSYKMIMAPEVAVVSRWPQDEITKIEKVDNYTVKATYKIMNIYCKLGWSIYPSKIFKDVVETNPEAINAHEFNLKPMYAGPYKIKEYVEGQYIIYEKNKNWFGGEPVLDTVTVRFIQDTNTILANLLTGTIDMG
ncbi:MAG TPA: S-layer homology domain-containing protein, partial [Caldisericia bacterium]|nr:S-layer homology domain-containing protein [Caldisericia bacterium]